MAPPRWPGGDAPTPAEAGALQAAWRERVIQRTTWRRLATVAGADVSVRGDRARAAVCVLSFPELAEIERSVAECEVRFPYVPGLLGFREVPCLLEAFGRLSLRPDAVLVDGQGRAHPRRFGVACHLGVELDLPAVGVAKSRLVGEHREPGARRGSRTRLVHEGEVIGAVLRTRAGVRPLFVSVGHRVDLEGAVRLVLATAKGFRLPEPIRAAHRAAGESETDPAGGLAERRSRREE